MSRTEINRFREMEVYVAAIEMGGFTQASRAFAMTPSAVSKLVARLEARLNTRLVNRSTRGLKLTAEGCVFYEDAKRLLADVEVAEQKLDRRSMATGIVRLNTSASYARHVLAPVLRGFVEQNPEIVLQLAQTDAVVDLLTDRADIAVRAGPLPDSSLKYRKLGESRIVIVAAPSYLQRHGRPVDVSELAGHRILTSSTSPFRQAWRFVEGGNETIVEVKPSLQGADGESVRKLAAHGLGIARTPLFTVSRDIERGRLVTLLEEFNACATEAFHALYLSHGEVVPTRVRLVLDFLEQHGMVRDSIASVAVQHQGQ